MLILLKKEAKDLETWRQVKATYLDYIRSSYVLNGFDSFYRKPTSPKGGTKKTKPLIVFLSLQISIV